MISYEQYDLLKKFNNNVFHSNNNYDNNVMQSLITSKLVEISNYTEYPDYCLISEYRITQLGKSAIEDYERTIESIDREQVSLSIAKEHNKFTKISNIIAWLALVVSIIAIIVSVFK